MTKSFDQESLILTAYSLRDVFRNCDTIEQAASAIERVLGDVNIVDTNEREGSLWRNRPLHLVLNDRAEDKILHQLEQEKRFAEIRQQAKDGTLPPKDWSKPQC